MGPEDIMKYTYDAVLIQWHHIGCMQELHVMYRKAIATKKGKWQGEFYV